MPRDIDSEVEELRIVYLYNMDHLEAIVRENVRSREREFARCHQIIAERAGVARAVCACAGPGATSPAPHPAWVWAKRGLPNLKSHEAQRRSSRLRYLREQIWTGAPAATLSAAAGLSFENAASNDAALESGSTTLRGRCGSELKPNARA